MRVEEVPPGANAGKGDDGAESLPHLVKQVTSGRRNENPRTLVAPLNCRQLHRQSGRDRVHDKMTINLGGRAIAS
jgi:hypothetical protein